MRTKMLRLRPYKISDGKTIKIYDYLKCNDVIDYDNEAIKKLAALLPCKSVPAGFCYQKLILNDEIAPVLIYHGLNGVYIKDYQKWIRLDARGNKTGVNAQFSIETEQACVFNTSATGRM